MLKKQIVWCAVILALFILAACSSVPKAPNFNSLDNYQDMRFVGEWEAEYYYYTLNADGTGVRVFVLGNGERVSPVDLNWRTTETWLSLFETTFGQQVTRPYVFSDDDQTVSFEDFKQVNGFNSGTDSWTKVGGD